MNRPHKPLLRKTLLASAVIAMFGAGVFDTALAAAQELALVPYAEMPAGKYDMDKTHASLTWKVSHLGLSGYTARFTDFDAAFTFDPQNIAASKVTATINPASIRTDHPDSAVDFDKKLSTDPQWFNTAQFPEIRFESTALALTGENTGILKGDLQFLGVTKPVELNVVFNAAMREHPFSQKPVMGFSATGKIKRSDWGMNAYVPNIGDDVDIIIEAEFVGN